MSQAEVATAVSMVVESSAPETESLLEDQEVASDDQEVNEEDNLRHLPTVRAGRQRQGSLPAGCSCSSPITSHWLYAGCAGRLRGGVHAGEQNAGVSSPDCWLVA